ncbi:hypothetical protein BDF22DRAFT_775365 [Syncephalis plumigaleata]|nr:hypothetical protein BDF22DRAFT_775365 [Syncephalis plumigaleata]
MKYSTTSLSAITLCVCMMLSHRTNGMDMRGTPSPFTNNNPNQIQMAGQQWNQQLNTNMQVGSNNWNTAATPMFLAPPGNSQEQLLDLSEFHPPEKMIIQATVDPNTQDVYIEFSGKYKFRPRRWAGNSGHNQYRMKPTWNGQKLLVTCYKENKRYEKVKAFYDHIEGLTDHVSKKELDSILLRRMDNAQSADKEIGCIVFEQPQGYISFTGLLKRRISFNLAKHIPNMLAQPLHILTIWGLHITALEEILIDFDRTVISKDLARNTASGQKYQNRKELELMYKPFQTDVKQTAVFINNFFTVYGKILERDFKITNPALLPQVELYNKQRESLRKLKEAMIKAEMPYMLFNVLMDHDNDYNLIAIPAIKTN